MRRITLIILMLVPLFVFSYQINISEDMLTFDKSGDYDIVSIEGIMASTYEPGAPGLPSYPVQLALPNGMEIASVDVTYSYPIELDGYFNIYPAQIPAKISDPKEEATFTPPNPAYYNLNTEFPGELVESFSSGNMGGFSVATINFTPLQYIPAQHKLILYTIINFEVTYKPMEGDKVYPRKRSLKVEERWRDIIKSMVINPDEVGYSGASLIDTSVTLDDDIVEYLIICDSDYSADLSDLEYWKTKKGYKAEIITTDDIYANYDGEDEQEQIRNCIIDYFENHGLLYVVLAGKVNKINYRSCYVPADPNYIPTEMYYADLDGTWNDDGDSYWGEPNDGQDFYYDVWLGRLPIADSEDAAEVIPKIFLYEGCSLAEGDTNPWDYLDQMLFMAGMLDSYTDGGDTKDYIDDNYVSSWWDITKLYESDGNMTTSNCIAEMNEGKNVVNHIHHSNEFGLGTQNGMIYSSQLYALENSPRITSTLYTIGCYAGYMVYPSNNAFMFVQAPDGGGVTMTSNNCYGWYSPGHYNMYSNDFDIEYFNQLCTEDLWVTGEIHAVHKYAYRNTAMSNTYYRYIYYELYQCGDPDIPIYTSEADDLTVIYEDSIPQGGQEYTVHVDDSTDSSVEGALVCIWKDDEVYAADLTDENGDATFAINPQSEGIILLTVTAHNFKPFETEVEVTDENTYIKLTSFTALTTDKGIELEWSVSTDIPINGFNLYRSIPETSLAPSNFDSSSSLDTAWTKVNTNLITGKNPYSFTDTTANTDTTYTYRLEAVTGENAEIIGETESTNSSVPSSFALNNVFPNPVYNSINVSIDIPENANIEICVYDITGRKVSTLASGLYAPGEYTITSDVNNLSSGVYILRMTSESFVSAKNFVIAK